MLLLLVCIFLFLDVKLLILLLDFFFDQACVPDSDIVVGAAWDLLAQVLEALS